MKKSQASAKITSLTLSILNGVLEDFANDMENVYSSLLLVAGDKVTETYFNKTASVSIPISKGDSWKDVVKNISWDKHAPHQGILNAEKVAFNIIRYDLEKVLHINYQLYLISSIDIGFPWLNSEISAIDTSIKAEVNDLEMQRQMEHTHQYTFAIMNALKIGVIAINERGSVLFANDHACVAVNTRRRDLLELPIKQLLPSWNKVYLRLLEDESIINEELSIKSKKFSVSITPIQDQLGQNLIGFVITMRELEHVYDLVNKYTGMQARFTFSDIVAKGEVMRKLIDYARTISDSPSTVFIEGESGTGKEVFAQSIHNASSRREAGFVAINCAAISESLIESELFGYDAGAFTGAKKGGHPGKFELADKGTLFLDEIGDMRPEMQVKLLRAIQEGTITRVGGERPIPVDVRIIAATNKNLKEEVEKGNFRLDLFYRLSVIPLKIPALRERKEDLPSLIRFFLTKKAARLHKPTPQLNFKKLQKFLDYSWPGNIRELENTIEQYVNLEGKLDFENKDLASSPWHKPAPTPLPEDPISIDTKLPSISEMERKLILKTLKSHNNNISKSAASLGIGRNTLYQKLKKHNITGL